MLSGLVRFIVFLMVYVCLTRGFFVKRRADGDYIYNITKPNCDGHNAFSHYELNSCHCKTVKHGRKQSFGVWNNNIPWCWSERDIGCINISINSLVVESNRTYPLVNNTFGEVVDFETSIYNINNNNVSYWQKIDGDFVRRFFQIDSYNLTINSTMDCWNGQGIKFNLKFKNETTNCLFVKFAGLIEYPTNVENIKSCLRKKGQFIPETSINFVFSSTIFPSFYSTIDPTTSQFIQTTHLSFQTISLVQMQSQRMTSPDLRSISESTQMSTRHKSSRVQSVITVEPSRGASYFIHTTTKRLETAHSRLVDRSFSTYSISSIKSAQRSVSVIKSTEKIGPTHSTLKTQSMQTTRPVSSNVPTTVLPTSKTVKTINSVQNAFSESTKTSIINIITRSSKSSLSPQSIQTTGMVSSNVPTATVQPTSKNDKSFKSVQKTVPESTKIINIISLRASLLSYQSLQTARPVSSIFSKSTVPSNSQKSKKFMNLAITFSVLSPFVVVFIVALLFLRYRRMRMRKKVLPKEEASSTTEGSSKNKYSMELPTYHVNNDEESIIGKTE